MWIPVLPMQQPGWELWAPTVGGNSRGNCALVAAGSHIPPLSLLLNGCVLCLCMQWPAQAVCLGTVATTAAPLRPPTAPSRWPSLTSSRPTMETRSSCHQQHCTGWVSGGAGWWDNTKQQSTHQPLPAPAQAKQPSLVRSYLTLYSALPWSLCLAPFLTLHSCRLSCLPSPAPTSLPPSPVLLLFAPPLPTHTHSLP